MYTKFVSQTAQIIERKRCIDTKIWSTHTVHRMKEGSQKEGRFTEWMKVKTQQNNVHKLLSFITLRLEQRWTTFCDMVCVFLGSAASNEIGLFSELSSAGWDFDNYWNYQWSANSYFSRK